MCEGLSNLCLRSLCDFCMCIKPWFLPKQDKRRGPEKTSWRELGQHRASASAKLQPRNQKLDSAKTVLHHVLGNMAPPRSIENCQVPNYNLLPMLCDSWIQCWIPFCPPTCDFDQICHDHIQWRWVLHLGRTSSYIGDFERLSQRCQRSVSNHL